MKSMTCPVCNRAGLVECQPVLEGTSKPCADTFYWCEGCETIFNTDEEKRVVAERNR